MFKLIIHHKLPGQSLTEYALGIGLVALVSAGALMMLGNQLQGSFAGMLGSAPAPSPIGASSTAAGGGSGETPSSASTGMPENLAPDKTGSALTLKEDAESIPADLPGFIQTAGANGTTSLFSNQLKQMGEQLLATGEINQDQANAFFNLANQGNRIATVEKLIEQADQSGSSSVTFEGKSYTPYELSRSIGWPDEPSSYYSMNVTSGADIVNRSPNNRSPEMQAFVSAYQTLEKSGGLSNPGIAQAVGAMGAKIAYLSEVVESNVADRQWGNTSVALQDYVASSTSYWKASEICGAGGGTTSGVTCQ